MKKAVKYLILALLLALTVTLCYIVTAEARARRHLSTCKRMEIIFRDTLNFVSEKDIRAFLKEGCPVFIGQRIDSIRLYEIEKVLDSRSAILSSQAWTSDSVLFVSITQREPAARIETPGNSFYIDDRGFIFPIQGDCGKKFSVIRMPSALQCRTWAGALLEMLEWMKKNRWDSRFMEMEMDSEGDLVLLPLEGKEKFIFGKAEDVPAKFGKINDYYKRIRPVMEEGYYSTVNVKYKGQIVCRK